MSVSPNSSYTDAESAEHEGALTCTGESFPICS